jgi:hypothetical protein
LYPSGNIVQAPEVLFLSAAVEAVTANEPTTLQLACIGR